MEKFSRLLEASGEKLIRHVAIAFVLLFSLVAGLVLHGLYQQQQMQATLDRVLGQRLQTIALTTALENTSMRRQQTVLAQLLATSAIERESLYGDYLETTEKLDKLRAALKQLPHDTNDRDAISRLDALVTRMDDLTEQALVLNTKGDRAKAIAVVQEKVLELSDAHAEVLDGLRQHQQSLMNEEAAATRAGAARARWVSAGLGALVCALILAVFLVVRRDLSQRGQVVSEKAREIESLSEQLFEEATRDALTGLANRRMFFQQLEHAVASGKRQAGQLALAYVDLDKFKQVNDTLGHAAGDKLLRIVAERMKSALREVDTLARLGGDEFAMVLEQASAETIAVLERRLREEVGKPVLIDGREVTPGFSIGFALFPEHSDSVQGLLQHADDEMYEQKARRKPTQAEPAKTNVMEDWAAV